MNKNAFKSLIILKGDTQKDVADALGVTEQTIGDKLNGVSDFKQTEIKTLIDRYDLTPEQVNDIFFDGNGGV